jgi:hypothetical protein
VVAARRLGTPGDFGPVILPLDDALDFASALDLTALQSV